MGAALPIIGLVAGIGGTAIQAAGAYGQMQAASANAAYQAQVAANNAKIAQMNETLQMQSGEQAAGIQAMKTRALVGATKAAQGASGIDVNTGSPVAVRAGEAEVGALDALTIRSNAARQAYGYAVQATSDTAQSQLLQTQAAQASAAAPWSAFGSLLSGASTVGGKYAQYVQQSGTSPLNILS